MFIIFVLSLRVARSMGPRFCLVRRTVSDGRLDEVRREDPLGLLSMLVVFQGFSSFRPILRLSYLIETCRNRTGIDRNRCVPVGGCRAGDSALGSAQL